MPVIRQRWRVLHELEAQCVHEEADRRVVLADHDGGKAEMHRASIGGLPCSHSDGDNLSPESALDSQTRPQRQMSACRRCRVLSERVAACRAEMRQALEDPDPWRALSGTILRFAGW